MNIQYPARNVQVSNLRARVRAATDHSCDATNLRPSRVSLRFDHSLLDFGYSKSSTRAAFSLVELLIVLAILATMAAFTIPALRGPMDKSKLRGAGRAMETAIAKARSLSIRSGQPHWLTYEPGGRAWQIETEPEPTNSAGGAATVSELTQETAAVEATRVVRTGVLPDGVTFAETTELASSEPADVLLSPQSNWSAPIRFTPIGRTANREIIIQGTRDFEMQIRVRGLTGSAIAELRRRVEASEEALLAGDQLTGSQPTTEPLR